MNNNTLVVPLLVPKNRSFGTEADLFLKELYTSVGSNSTPEKINLLNLILGEEFPFYQLSDATKTEREETQLGCLEYEYLRRAGKNELALE